MTIPIVPGPFSFLKGATDAGLDAYYRAQQRKDMLDQIKRQQDLQNTSMFMQMLQSGMLQPSSTPEFQFPGMAVPGVGVVPPAQIPAQTSYDMPGGVGESFARLGFGQPKFSKPPRLEQEESAARVAKGTEQPTIDLAGTEAGAAATKAKFDALLIQLKTDAADDPAVARALAGILPAGVARGREAAAEASVAPEAYMFAAENFVAQAGGNAKAALKAAGADPQYAELVKSGQLSEEYFSRAAKDYARLNTKEQQAWAEIAARRASQQSQERLYYDSVIRSFDREIGQAQAMRKQFELSNIEGLMAETAKKKAAAGQPLSDIEKGALDKVTKQTDIDTQIQTMQGEREDIRSRYIGRTIPGPAAGTGTGTGTGTSTPAPLSAKAQTVFDALKAGKLTKADVQKSSALTEAEKASILGRIP